MVIPRSTSVAYRPLSNHVQLDLIFSIQEERMVRSDNTISFTGKEYLIQASKQRVSFAKATVTVHQCIEGSIRIFYKG